MIHTTCPMCDRVAVLEDDRDAFDCSECGIRLELAEELAQELADSLPLAA